jgi:hypothetical protein
MGKQTARISVRRRYGGRVLMERDHYKLALCRLCGAKAEHREEAEQDRHGHTLFYVRCMVCLIRTINKYNRRDAAVAWNDAMRPRPMAYAVPKDLEQLSEHQKQQTK